MNGEEVFAEVAHDLRGALGSIRLVMGSLVDEADEAHRDVMLRLADEEVQRLAAGLAALPALGRAVVDVSEASEVDLRSALADAAAVAARHGGTVVIGAVPPVALLTRPALLALVLPAVMLLACGIEGSTVVSAEVASGAVAIVCTGGPLWPQALHLLERLAGAVGGAACSSESGARITIPMPA